MRAKIILGALAILCVVVPASAEECKKPLKILASLPMTSLGNSGIVTVPISVNGVEKQFLLDTGGYFAQVSSAVADELKLTQHQGALELYGEDGTRWRNEAVIRDFAIGPVHAQNYEIPVAPLNGYDGLFSPIADRNIDFEMDFAAKKMNMFLSDHCDGKVVYWPSKALAIVPFTINYANHIVVPVTIDGHELKATIDTGQSYTTIFLNRSTESTFDLDPNSRDMTAVGHIGNNQHALIFSHPFKTMSFGDIVVTNPHIQFFTDMMPVRPGPPIPPVIIGMDVLRKLHLYLALREEKLYITEASAPADAPSTATSTSTAAPADAAK